MHTMKVSIIIPTKNNAGILEKCLKSIEDLDYPKEELEVVIVDGHSEDGTVEIARKYGCRVVYESVGTIGGARNIIQLYRGNSPCFKARWKGLSPVPEFFI